MSAQRFRSHFVPFFLGVMFLLSGVASTTASARDRNPVIRGTPCAKAGAERKVKNVAYTCVVVGKRRLWAPTRGTSSSSTVAPTTTSTSTTAARRTAPVLTHAPVDRAGLFCAPEAHLHFNSEYFFCFEPFGAVATEPDGRQKRMPHYTYRLKGGAKIYAAADGIVSDILYQESHRDFEFHLDLGDMLWLLVYDHVDRVLVPKGTRVKIGRAHV